MTRKQWGWFSKPYGGQKLTSFIHFKIDAHFQIVYEENSKKSRHCHLRARTPFVLLTTGAAPAPVHTPDYRLGTSEKQPLSLWNLLTYPLLPHPPQTLAGEALGEFIPPGATLTGVPAATLGAGPPDSRDTDGFIQGSHLLLELKQSERKGKQL